MKKFTIEMCRTSYAFESFEVEANTEEEAIKKAEQMAYNTCFQEDDAEYSVEGIEIHEGFDGH